MLIHEAHNEQRLAFQIHRDPGSKLRDFEGLQLLEIPIESGHQDESSPRVRG
jgi:hypothetical protein